MTERLPRTPPAPLAAIALLLACGTSPAAEVEERIARCAAAATPDARIACLELELRALAGAPRVADADAGNLDAPAPRPPQEPEPAARADEPPPAIAKGSPAAAQELAPAAEPAPVTTPAAPSAVELGAEQVEARTRSEDEDTPRVRAQVVDFRFVGYERLMVQLDNGQVWRQIDGDRESVERGLRDAGTFEVEMWATKLGGYRMRILPLGRTIRVERLR